MATLHASPTPTALDCEDHVVAELDALGVSFLTCPIPAGEEPPGGARSPATLLADMVRQPSARVRAAVIALLLARPDLWPHVEPAAAALPPPDRAILMLSYTAAALLQIMHEAALKAHLGPQWKPLPDLFSATLGLHMHTVGLPERRLKDLAACHVRLTGSDINWEGTYRNAAARLLRQWEMEARWMR